MPYREIRALAIGLALVGVVHAQSIPDERMKQKMADDFALIKRHAETYYPAITHATHLPEGVVIGFIVTRDLKVLDHSVALNPPAEGTSTADEVRKMFPGKRIAERSGGGGCFGGGKSKDPKWCVVFAELEK
jgi:hypothetical protein